FQWGFLAAGVGMLFGIISFELMKKKYLVTPDGQAVGAISNKRRDAEDKATAIEAEKLSGIKSQEAPVKEGKISNTSIMIWAVVALALIAMFHYVMDQDWIGSCIFSVSIAAPGLILSDSSLSK